jgi:curved DNA-binding protein CbpA
MQNGKMPDHYEVLQVSSRADQDTIERVFRHLAKRYHPDTENGEAGRFAEIVEAYRVLSSPDARAEYDARYESIREEHWRAVTEETAVDQLGEDRRIRFGILSLLYSARRNDVDRPGLGPVEMERVLACPEEHLKFHVWYLKENGWLQRLENGHYAITASGVDKVMEMGSPGQQAAPKRITPGSGAPAA